MRERLMTQQSVRQATRRGIAAQSSSRRRSRHPRLLASQTSDRIASGKIPHVRLPDSARVLVKRSDVEALIESWTVRR